jgi:DNA-directed RNA polymerase specialized sigma24 family protein
VAAAGNDRNWDLLREVRAVATDPWVSATDREDAVSASVLYALEHLAKDPALAEALADSDRRRHWLRGVYRNSLKDCFRRRRRERSLPDAELVTDPQPGPDAHADGIKERLERASRAVDPGSEAALAINLWLGRTTLEEEAQKSGKSVHTVRRSFLRGLGHLGEFLGLDV